MRSVDVVIVGAGPAGLGMALMLARVPDVRQVVLEAGEVGQSFRLWPEQTRFITPSFYSSPFGLADLNAIDGASSPVVFSGTEHPSGDQYADYLSLVADGHGLPVLTHCRVETVVPQPGGGFVLQTSDGELHCRFLLWATGEYQFPDLTPFPGGQWCPHYAQVRNWADRDEGPHTVIGGYESGVDAAVQLARLGRRVRLLARKSTWDAAMPNDPSLSLSPFSRQRLYEALDTGHLEIVFGVDVAEVSRDEAGGYRIHAADGRHWAVSQPPILGTGFIRGGGAHQIRELWDWTEGGQVRLSPVDESTRTPGLFLLGPQVRQEQRIYCFIYKFRQRFGLIADQIARRLVLDAASLQAGEGSWGPFGNTDCCEGCEC
ncbi:MAG: NAD(P)-binding domain-containing protein [Lautropia sp.]|nr:NAD(P)-binding domain-containing protein [Lautropia sp.]